MIRVLAVLGAIVLLALLSVFFFASPPDVELVSAPKTIGTATPVKVRIESPHGVRRVTAYLEQGGTRHKVYETAESPVANPFFRSSVPPKTVEFPAGSKLAKALKDGPARLIVEAQANNVLARTDSVATDVQVNTQPPTVSADGHQHYINQGGTELVTFRVGGSWDEAGVRVGKYTFRSFPMPGQTDPKSPDRFALFAFPHDVAVDTVPVVYARNAAGNEATAGFWYRVFPKPTRKRDLPLDDTFLQKVVAELDPSGSGSLADRFVKINSQMRRENNQTLTDLADKTELAMLWSGPFFRLGQTESFFADHRSYIYGGKKIDEQVHLGYDLSDVQAAPIKAANSGKIVFAGPLGIYGNCIVVDHGYGLQSIYGHLRQIDVKVGDSVAKEQVMGRSGATGLAGGDHLHYSMQVDGVQVNPLEWWDAHWIQDRILSKLPAKQASAIAAQ